MESGQLIDEIELLRYRLVRLGEQLGLAHPEVQQCSEQLDELLLIYLKRDLQSKGDLSYDS